MSSASAVSGPRWFAVQTLSNSENKAKKYLGPIGILLVLLVKFGAKLKFLVLPFIKFFPVLLKTGGTMLISIWAYSMFWGWKFAAGFVILILLHEFGHLIAARIFRLKVGLPVFIPFMGALIALKEAPRHAWVEFWIAAGGPIAGGLASFGCHIGLDNETSLLLQPIDKLADAPPGLLPADPLH